MRQIETTFGSCRSKSRFNLSHASWLLRSFGGTPILPDVERDSITGMWILNAYVPFKNAFVPGHKPNSYISGGGCLNVATVG
jgi:hypothetical protein